MRKLLLATAATALVGWAAGASASTIAYNILVNGTSVKTGMNTKGTLNVTAKGSGFTIDLSAVGAPAQSAPNLSTNDFNIDRTGGAGTIEIDVTNYDLSSPSTIVQNTFTTNSLDGSGFEGDTITNYFDSSDTPYGMGSTMASATYTGLGSFSTPATDYTIMPNGLFSETTVYKLTFGAGATNSTVSASSQIVAATPEPNSLVLLGTGLIGAAGMLFMRRRGAESLL